MQWTSSTAHTGSSLDNGKDKSTSADSRNEKPNTNQTEKVKPATVQPFRIKRSFSVNSMTNIQKSVSLSRSPDDELQQKLNRRLIKETDPDALEKFESVVQRNMSQNRAAIGQIPVS